MDVRPNSFCKRMTKSLMTLDMTGSRPEVGSSYNTILGWEVRARARPTRFFIPPEILLGKVSFAGTKSSHFNFSMTIRSSSSPEAILCSRKGRATFS